MQECDERRCVCVFVFLCMNVCISILLPAYSALEAVRCVEGGLMAQSRPSPAAAVVVLYLNTVGLPLT